MIFKKMFTDSEMGIKISCSHTKVTVIVKNALAPYYHQKVTTSLSNPFSILMDESNDKVN